MQSHSSEKLIIIDFKAAPHLAAFMMGNLIDKK